MSVHYELKLQSICCPYCGESIEIQIDCSERAQDYIEDCQVCCRPINLHVNIDEGGQPSVTALHENE